MFPRPNRVMHPDPAIRAIESPRELDRAVAVIVLAFASDPVARWSMPDASAFLRSFPALVRAFGGNGFAHGAAWCASDLSGAALWLPPGVAPDEEGMAIALEDAADGAHQEEVYDLMERMQAFHPTEAHWYLPLIGVDPMRQGRGCGDALMRCALRRCDEDGVPAYLESTNPRNLSLYQRHGFEVIGRIQVGSSPVMHAMLRSPRAAR